MVLMVLMGFKVIMQTVAWFGDGIALLWTGCSKPTGKGKVAETSMSTCFMQHWVTYKYRCNNHE